MTNTIPNAQWRQLISLLARGEVIPVIGSELMVDQNGESLQKQMAIALLEEHGVPPESVRLLEFQELACACAALRKPGRENPLLDSVKEAIRSVCEEKAKNFPKPLAQLAEISAFRMIVTLTTDDLLARALGSRNRNFNAIPYSPSQDTAGARVLNTRSPADLTLVYLFGNSADTAFAIHDEDFLEYVHSLLGNSGLKTPPFLQSLRDSSLLFIGCHFPDWLGHFVLRTTRNERISTGNSKRRIWLVQTREDDRLVSFLRAFAGDIEVLGNVSPSAFVEDLYVRWKAAGSPMAPKLPTSVSSTISVTPDWEYVFFISYSWETDSAAAEGLRDYLETKCGKGTVWLDKDQPTGALELTQTIKDKMEKSRYVLPLISDGALTRQRGIVFSEWRYATDTLEPKMNVHRFIYPLYVGQKEVTDLEHVYRAPASRRWKDKGIVPGHIFPEGAPSDATKEVLIHMIREYRGSH